MKADLFDYELPERLIARHPPEQRDGARLLELHARGVRHGRVQDLWESIPSGALVVLNETRVRKARLLCRRRRSRPGEGGGRVELLFLEPTPSGTWRALGRANRPLRIGDRLELGDGLEVDEGPMAGEGNGQPWFEVLEREADGTLVIDVRGSTGTRAEPAEVERMLEAQGEMPVPPYLRRAAEASDALRYQTVFAERLGSVAAPTAGLHLTEAALERLTERGVQIGRLVLHVGVGTFRPVTVDDLDQHDMHTEQVEVTGQVAEQVALARARGAPVIAIGTTTVRALETAADPDRPSYVRAYSGPTRLLIQPGYAFRVIDGLLTNFHMPRSTLLALVSAFAGRERVLAAYREAVLEGYRFLSYGDAMWLPERLA